MLQFCQHREVLMTNETNIFANISALAKHLEEDAPPISKTNVCGITIEGQATASALVGGRKKDHWLILPNKPNKMQKLIAFIALFSIANFVATEDGKRRAWGFTNAWEVFGW